MKKIVCFIFAILVSGCSLSAHAPKDSTVYKKKYNIEKQGRLNITVDTEAYKYALLELWYKTYPQHPNTLHIKVKKYTFSQHIQGDIDWVKDSDAIYRIKEAYPIASLQSNLEYTWNKHLQRKDTKDYFLPVEGKGLLFVYNDYTLTQRKGTVDDLKSMEAMQKFKTKVYYHNRYADYVYPLLFQDYKPLQRNRIPMMELFQDAQFTENLKAYKQLNDALALEDGIFDVPSFYEDDKFLCGLTPNDRAYEKTKEYKEGHLHFSSMPKFQKKPLSPQIDTFGFMVHKDVKYPNATMAFLQMVRSKEGIQAILKKTKMYPLLKQEDIEDFGIFDVNIKEILGAMNASQLKSMLDIEENPAITFERLYQNSDFLSIVQNYTYTRESAKNIQKKIQKDTKQWILKH